MNYFFYFDYTYFIFMLPAFIISMFAQIQVQSTFFKYSKMRNARALTGEQAAYQVLARNGVHNVEIQRIAGALTDHFDPRDQVIRLSDAVYANSSVAAVGVAAHEAGHAVQYAVGYAPIKMRQVLIPVTRFGSSLSMPLILIGLLLPNYHFFILAGIALFSLAVLFQVVTLPVEFNASRRAIETLETSELLYGEELEGAKRVLRAAAMTYVAATFTSLLSLLRLLIIFGNRRGND